MSTTVHKITASDTAVILSDTLKKDGVAINLSGCTVQLRLRHIETGDSDNYDATVVSAAAGTVRYALSAVTDWTPGKYLVQWVVTFSDLTVIHVPNDSFVFLEILTGL